MKLSEPPTEAAASPVWWKAGRRSGVVMVVAILIAVALMIAATQSDLPREAVGGILLLLMLVLMAFNVPVGIAMALTGFIGVWSLAGMRPFVGLATDGPYASVTNFSLTVIPMFVFMGLILWRSGITADLYRAAKHWLGWLPGGLAVTTNLAGAGLGAASGSTLGITYALGRIGIPEMLKAGYDKRLATGAVMSSGTIGQLIPPSIMLVLYAGFAEVPVGKQLMAGVIPGIVLTITYVMLIVVLVSLKPKWAPRPAETAQRDWGVVWKDTLRCWPIPIVAIIILGGISSGIFTATEAGAVGALASLIAAVFSLGVKDTLRAAVQALRDTVVSVGSIFLVLMGATILNKFLALSGTAQLFADQLIGSGMSGLLLILLLIVFYLILGMFMDPIAMMLLTVPILLPAVVGSGLSPIWFGVFVVLMAEIAILSPPVGMLAFVTHKITQASAVNLGQNITLMDVFKGALLFVPPALAATLIVSLWPELVTWLPEVLVK